MQFRNARMRYGTGWVEGDAYQQYLQDHGITAHYDRGMLADALWILESVDAFLHEEPIPQERPEGVVKRQVDDTQGSDADSNGSSDEEETDSESREESEEDDVESSEGSDEGSDETHDEKIFLACSPRACS